MKQLCVSKCAVYEAAVLVNLFSGFTLIGMKHTSQLNSSQMLVTDLRYGIHVYFCIMHALSTKEEEVNSKGGTNH